jgi:hypothetical protein
VGKKRTYYTYPSLPPSFCLAQHSVCPANQHHNLEKDFYKNREPGNRLGSSREENEPKRRNNSEVPSPTGKIGSYGNELTSISGPHPPHAEPQQPARDFQAIR